MIIIIIILNIVCIVTNIQMILAAVDKGIKKSVVYARVESMDGKNVEDK